jgi:hypothetical protein
LPLSPILHLLSCQPGGGSGLFDCPVILEKQVVQEGSLYWTQKAGSPALAVLNLCPTHS